MTGKTAVNNQDVTVEITKRKGQKRVIIRPIAPNKFMVTAPYGLSKKKIMSLFETHYDNFKTMPHPIPIETHFKDQAKITLFEEIVTLNFKKGKKSSLKEPNKLTITNQSTTDEHHTIQLKSFLKTIIDKEIQSLITKYNPYFKTIDLNNLTFRYNYLKSKFGSCQPQTKRISINLELVHYPKPYLEYIFAHEIAHLVHANHSSRFYALLDTLYPRHKQAKKHLNLYRKQLLYGSFTTLINTLKEEV